MICRSTTLDAVEQQPRSGILAKVPALPFVKLAGQDDMKLALLLNVVDQTIGGVLIMGDRGTGKSVAVRLSVSICKLTHSRMGKQSPALCEVWSTATLLGSSRPDARAGKGQKVWRAGQSSG